MLTTKPASKPHQRQSGGRQLPSLRVSVQANAAKCVRPMSEQSASPRPPVAVTDTPERQPPPRHTHDENVHGDVAGECPQFYSLTCPQTLRQALAIRPVAVQRGNGKRKVDERSHEQQEPAKAKETKQWRNFCFHALHPHYGARLRRDPSLPQYRERAIEFPLLVCLVYPKGAASC